MHATFIDALNAARTKRNLMGMPMDPQETRDITAGFAEGATDRLDSQRQFDQNQQQINLAERADNRQYKIATGRMEQDEPGFKDYAIPLMGAFAGSETGSEMIGGAVEAIGSGVKSVVSVIGKIAKGTWICTEVKDKKGLSDQLWDGLKPFREYCKAEHPEWYYFYTSIGPALVGSMNNDPEKDKVYSDLKKELIAPVVFYTRCGKTQDAFNLYRDMVLALIMMYRPDLLNAATLIDNADQAEPKRMVSNEQ